LLAGIAIHKKEIASARNDNELWQKAELKAAGHANGDNVSVRTQGNIAFPAAGAWKLSFRHDDDVWVWIDGNDDGTEAGSGEVWSRGGWDGGQWRGDMNVKVASTKAVRYAVAIKQGGGGVMWGARWKGPGVGSWQSAHSAMSGVSIQIHPKDKFNNLKSADPQPW
jgi:hypothetical protein